MTRVARVARIALAAAAILAGPGIAQPPMGRTEVPIRQVRLSDGTIRYAVPLTVGGQPVLAGLDTGSTGLRLLPAAQHDLQPTPRSSHEQFGSGVVLDGPVARGTVAIGARGGTIGVQQVERIGCAGRPCGANIGLDRFGILGNGLPGEGFAALIGIRPVPDSIPRNPLAQLGVRRWIVSLPRPGERGPGRLVLDPDEREVRGFVPVPGGDAPGQVRACLYRPLPRPSRACGATMIDSGAPGLTVASSDFPAQARPGGPARLVFGDGPGPAPSMTLRLDDPAQVTRYRVVQPTGRGPVIRAGVTPYLAYDILYDGAAGTIAVRPRPPYPGGPVAQ